MTDIRTIPHFDNVQLNETYTNITLHVHDRGTTIKWVDVTGAFYLEGMYPRFRRQFPDGRTCEYGMHTPSRRIDFEVGGHVYTPNALYEKQKDDM